MITLPPGGARRTSGRDRRTGSARHGHPGECPTVHVTLVGPTGCGKSTVGIHLARRLGRPFYDGHPNVNRCDDGPTRDLADRSWFESIAASTPAAVIAAPISLLVRSPDLLRGDDRWVVFLDAPDMTPDATGDDGDREAIRRTAHAVCDVRIDGARPVLDVVDDIIGAWRERAVTGSD